MPRTPIVVLAAMMCVASTTRGDILAQAPARHADLVLMGGKVFTADSAASGRRLSPSPTGA